MDYLPLLEFTCTYIVVCASYMERETQREREREREREKERERENSNSKTLFYKDCSLGSVKNLSDD